MRNRKLTQKASQWGWPATNRAGATGDFCKEASGLSKPHGFWSAKFTALLAQGDQGVGIYSIFNWLGLQPHSTSSTRRLGQLY